MQYSRVRIVACVPLVFPIVTPRVKLMKMRRRSGKCDRESDLLIQPKIAFVSLDRGRSAMLSLLYILYKATFFCINCILEQFQYLPWCRLQVFKILQFFGLCYSGKEIPTMILPMTVRHVSTNIFVITIYLSIFLCVFLISR